MSPAAMIVGLPNRSVSRPDSGARANIPNVWPLITSPTLSTRWPWAVMWTGVIVMIRTITTWLATRPISAAATVGRRSSSRTGVAPGRGRVVHASASANGSGRSSANDRTQAVPTNTIGTR